MYTKKDLKKNLEDAGFLPTDTVIVHSSMKSIGPVEGRADTVLDAFQEYFFEGVIAFPTLTWQIGFEGTPEAGNFFSVNNTPGITGILPELFRKRPGVLRSCHPSHSVAAYGKRAADFIAGHEKAKTSLCWESPWGRLYDWSGKIFFIGTGIGCNTFLHAVEEKAAIPGLMNPNISHVIVEDRNGQRTERDIQRHHPHHSLRYYLVEPLLTENGACRKAVFGDARCHVLDARRTADLVFDLLKRRPQFFIEKKPL